MSTLKKSLCKTFWGFNKSDNCSYHFEISNIIKIFIAIKNYTDEATWIQRIYCFADVLTLLILMKVVFPLNQNSVYNTRNSKTFFSGRVRTVKNGTESLAFLASKIWELVPYNIKNLDSLAKSFDILIKLIIAVILKLVTILNFYRHKE